MNAKLAPHMSISTFFPVYNDWGTVGSMTALAILTLEQITDDYEVILVDDGSDSLTQDVLRHIGTHYPDRVRIIHHRRNRGYGAALKTGFAQSTKEFIFYTDGDAQYDVRELKKLVAAMTDGIDIVNGYKIKRSDPWYRVVLGKLYHWVTKQAFGLKIRDVDCDFRLIRKSLIDKIHLHHDSGVICVEMITKMHDVGARFAEVPVHHYFRVSGRSEFFNFRRVFRVGIDLVELWWHLVVRKKLKVFDNA